MQATGDTQQAGRRILSLLWVLIAALVALRTKLWNPDIVIGSICCSAFGETSERELISYMDKPRPYVTAALLCEKVIQEKDESITIVRIADRLQYRLEGQSLPAGVRPMVNIQGLVSIKSGPVTGDHEIKIFAERPSGERKEVMALPVKLLGNDQGQNIILNLGIGVDQDGLYWLEVMFDGEVLTRCPLMITPLPTGVQGAPKS